MGTCDIRFGYVLSWKKNGACAPYCVFVSGNMNLKIKAKIILF